MSKCGYCGAPLLNSVQGKAHVDDCWETRVKPLGHDLAVQVLQGKLTVQEAEARR